MATEVAREKPIDGGKEQAALDARCSAALCKRRSVEARRMQQEPERTQRSIRAMEARTWAQSKERRGPNTLYNKANRKSTLRTRCNRLPNFFTLYCNKENQPQTYS
eukprot:958202-Pleurochrysis_carterae.AAC.1